MIWEKFVGHGVLPKSCSFCSSRGLRKHKEPELIEKFLESHKCLINHIGSGESMDSTGLVDCFMFSTDTRKFNYTSLRRFQSVFRYCNRNPKAYLDIPKNDAYPATAVKKLECVEHIQKCVDNCLLNLSNTMKNPLADGRTFRGRGRLTDKTINKLQNYYGVAM